MVDPHPVRVAQGGPQQVAVGGVAGGVEPVGTPRGQAPVLALLAERVRRRADVHAHREHVLQRPAVRPLRVAADGEVVHDPHADLLPHRVHVGQLALHLVLQPRVEGHPRSQLEAGPVDVRRRRVPQPLGPQGPPAPVPLGQGTEDGELPQVVRRADGLGSPGRVPQQLAGRPLGRPHPVVLDPVAGDVRTQHVHLGTGGVVRGAVGVEIGHAQGERRGEPPARRRVGRRLHRRHGRDRVQRVEQHRLGAVLAAGPADELAQVAEIADAPRPLRAQRVELQHPAPRPRRLRERGGRHDHGDVAAELLVDQLQAVVARLEVVGQLGDVRARALGVDQHARPGQRPHRADAVRDRARQRAERRLLPGQRQRGRPGLRLGRVDVEQAEDPDDDVVVDLDDLAFTVAVGGGDAVRGRQLDQVGVHDPIVPRRPVGDAAGCSDLARRPPRRRRPRGARRRGR